MKKVLLFVMVAGVAITSCKKKGCTDPLATNFDEKAKKNDNSCTYDEVQEVITDDGSGTGTVTWTKNKVYVLDGLVFVNDGQTLTIEAGTIIKGKEGQGENASALVVARGGKIIAEGTKDEPIIFTAISDPITRLGDGTLQAGSLPNDARGLWGGVIILGKAPVSLAAGEVAVEGIPTTESRGLYGGNDASDDSGILKYVKIKHGGTDIGAGNEINGLTLGGVGNGTTIEYIEVIANKDDGIEWFGGTVNCRYLVVSNCGDDSFDYDEGWRGSGQFWFTYQDSEGDRGGEFDGSRDPEVTPSHAMGIISNATFYGNATSRAITLRDYAGGEFYNSIFTNFGKGIDIEMKGPADSDTYDNFVAGKIVFKNNTVFDVAADVFKIVSDADSDGNKIADSTELANANVAALAYWNDAANGNNTDDPGLNSKLIPSTAGTVTMPLGSFFTTVNYRGAFDPAAAERWIDGWTTTAEFVK